MAAVNPGEIAFFSGPASQLSNSAPRWFSANGGQVVAVLTLTPTTARLNVLQQFTLTGSGFTNGTTVAISDCTNDTSFVPSPANSSTSITFRCTPTLPGAKSLTVNGAVVPNVSVRFDHPARLGDVGARGVPTVKGVSLFNGNVHLEATDLAVPGKGVSFALTRSYNSYHSDLEAGRGSVSSAAPWRFNWDLKLGYVTGDTKKLWVQREDGAGENFFKDSDGVWYPIDQGNFNTLKGDTPVAGQTTLMTREGLKYIFQNPDLGGLLIGIVDHDGNGLAITRDASKRVSVVTDASGRAYSFSYYTDSYGLLRRVTDFANRYVEYTWETGASGVRLKTVRDVRGGITTYNYTPYSSSLGQGAPPAQYLLTSIMEPVGTLAATPYAALTYTYTDKVYGNWGASSVKDAEGKTWSFVYCVKLTSASACSSGATQIDPTGATGFEVTTTPPQGAVTLARFDTAGRLIEQVNANNKLSKTTPMPLAGIASQNYNLAALPTKKQSALGVTGSYGTDFDYTADKAGNLAKRTDAEGNSTQNAWLANAALLAKNLHRVETLTTATGASHGFSYTSTSGNVASYKPPGLAAIQLAYDSAGQVTAVTDSRSNTTNRSYDANGNLTKVTGPDAPLYTENTYDALGRVQTSRDKRGAITSTTYDDAGNVLSVTDALNNTVTSVYDANDNRTQVTDARGNVTRYAYDKNNRLKTVSKVLGTQTLTTTNTYDALGRITSTVNANNHTSTTTFDDEGNVLARANALAHTTQYQYDDDDRVIKTTDPEGRVTDTTYDTTYDKIGRVKSVKTAAGTTSYDYDGDGRMTASTDARGKKTQYTYDAAGRLKTLVDAENQTTSATFDDNGNLLTVTDPRGRTTTYTYDKLNRPLTRTDANGQQWVNVYDENGNLQTRTVPGNKTTRFTYDALNRVTQVDYPDASVVRFTYDANSNRASMIDSTGTTSYSYDALNRLSSKTDPQGKAVSYAYDGIGNVTTLGYPGGQSVAYAYDAAERLTSLTDWLGKTTSYTLNKAAQVTTALFGNGSRADMAYDTAGRLTSLVNKKADGSVISSHVMTLDANGNITQSSTQLPLQPSLGNPDRTFTYDPANRLATYNGSAVTHDSAGRITALSGATYSYNDRDQITAITGSQTASYAYNGDGHRVTRNINGQSTRFVIDANRGLPEVLAETDNAGTVQRRYVHGYGLVEQIDSANAASYYHFDPTGNTLALTNATGALSDSYAYTPYGETNANGSTVNPFRYSGKYGVMDDGNGLIYMRARFYRPDVARFMSLDALPGEVNNPQSLNRYAYVRGNPIMGVDPSGRHGCDLSEDPAGCRETRRKAIAKWQARQDKKKNEFRSAAEQVFSDWNRNDIYDFAKGSAEGDFKNGFKQGIKGKVLAGFCGEVTGDLGVMLQAFDQDERQFLISLCKLSFDTAGNPLNALDHTTDKDLETLGKLYKKTKWWKGVESQLPEEVRESSGDNSGSMAGATAFVVFKKFLCVFEKRNSSGLVSCGDAPQQKPAPTGSIFINPNEGREEQTGGGTLAPHTEFTY
ncbi:MAG: RHS repeat protein [Rhodoferax sp.]|nr:RHS repeat protein [Rhodoferax sp.]